ncbi:MAG: hypothetical protein H3C30_14765 [Candidatus Hydrogenedentes bacterium]|nr:hypothetical protein [Candidatus Hydrogenedentota bacterium]
MRSRSLGGLTMFWECFSNNTVPEEEVPKALVLELIFSSALEGSLSKGYSDTREWIDFFISYYSGDMYRGLGNVIDKAWAMEYLAREEKYIEAYVTTNKPVPGRWPSVKCNDELMKQWIKKNPEVRRAFKELCAHYKTLSENDYVPDVAKQGKNESIHAGPCSVGDGLRGPDGEHDV